MKHKKWTKEEMEYLTDKWGTLSKPAIAQKLDRSVNAVTVRAQRLGLGALLDAGDGEKEAVCSEVLRDERC